MAPELLDFQVNNCKATRRGNRDLDIGPQGVYPVQGEDRWIAITVQSDENWVSLQTLMGTPQWAKEKRFETTLGRIAAHDLLDKGISEWTAELDGCDLETKLLAVGIPAGLVARSSDLLTDPQYQHLGFYRWHDHPAMGRVPYAGHQYSIEGYDHGPRAAAPLLGEHTFEVLTDFLDFDADAIAQLAIDGGLG
jgi:crotonobetainyl-CoA:carnitine CoA-transferase CaiB-like acyl-CoA transferase